MSVRDAAEPLRLYGRHSILAPFLRDSSSKWFCSELVAGALRDLAGWQVDPAKARPLTVYVHLGGKR